MDRESTLLVLYKKVNKPPKEITIKNDLESMQCLVGGLIEVVNYKDDLLLICNEEGKINNSLPNLMFENDVIAGDCFFVKDTENGDFSSLVEEDIMKIKKDISKRSIKYLDKEIENEL